MMEVRNLSYHYKGCPEVLKDVSFDMEPGKFLAILGNNGVGKSTLLKCFNHILKPDSGEVILDGENLLRQSPREVAKKVAFVSQSVPSTQMTVHDVVMLGRRPYMKWGFTEAFRWRKTKSHTCPCVGAAAKGTASGRAYQRAGHSESVSGAETGAGVLPQRQYDRRGRHSRFESGTAFL